MNRIAVFIDGSNLTGSLKKMNARIVDFHDFFHYIYSEMNSQWNSALFKGNQAQIDTVLVRANWYGVGTIDYWDFKDSKCKDILKDWFLKSKHCRNHYMSAVGKELGLAGDKLLEAALGRYFKDVETWYLQRKDVLDGLHKFHHAIKANTDFIDVFECGHWKLDMINFSMEEKGVDTRLAVDMIAMENAYDTAVLISGDADGIPSGEHIKRMGKQFGVMEFIQGHPPEKKGRQASSKLKVAADFVVQIYETDLHKNKLIAPM